MEFARSVQMVVIAWEGMESPKTAGQNNPATVGNGVGAFIRSGVTTLVEDELVVEVEREKDFPPGEAAAERGVVLQGFWTGCLPGVVNPAAGGTSVGIGSTKSSCEMVSLKSSEELAVATWRHSSISAAVFSHLAQRQEGFWGMCTKTNRRES